MKDRLVFQDRKQGDLSIYGKNVEMKDVLSKKFTKT